MPQIEIEYNQMPNMRSAASESAERNQRGDAAR